MYYMYLQYKQKMYILTIIDISVEYLTDDTAIELIDKIIWEFYDYLRI